MNQKVVVVDDEPRIVSQVTSVLLSDGYEVIVAENGADAQAKMAVEDPWLLVLGEVLPDMPGYRLLENLCVPHRADLPPDSRYGRKFGVIALTHPDFVWQNRGSLWDSIPAAYLTKPFNPEEFREFVYRTRLNLQSELLGIDLVRIAPSLQGIP